MMRRCIPTETTLKALCIALFVLCLVPTQGLPSGGNAGATVVYLEGTLTMDGKPLKTGSAIQDGSILKTAADSRAEIMFSGKNIIRMGSSTSMRVYLKDLQRSMQIENGTVTAVFRKLDKAVGGGMKVTTPSVIAGVRGTIFCVWVSGTSKETYFCTCNGRIEFAPGGTKPEIVKEARHHEAMLFTGTGDGASASVPDAEYNPRHTDSDLESLAGRIGQKMDWTNIEE
jgi:hypothetical protein